MTYVKTQQCVPFDSAGGGAAPGSSRGSSEESAGGVSPACSCGAPCAVSVPAWLGGLLPVSLAVDVNL